MTEPPPDFMVDTSKRINSLIYNEQTEELQVLGMKLYTIF